MSEIPRLRAPDSALSLLLEGYEFIPRRCRRLGTDAFETRILTEPVVCMTGREAAELFYGTERLTRKRGIPKPTLTLLQDLGSVGVLDGEAHRHRKRMFMELMAPESVRELAQLTERHWDEALERWSRAESVRLDERVAVVLCLAACAWTGVPVGEQEVERRAADLASMFDGAGAIGPRRLRGQLGRHRGERWIRDVVRQVRSGRLEVSSDRPLSVIAHHRGLDGGLLEVEVAAVEVINLLRPIVAITRFVTWTAMALHEHPAWAERLRAGDADDLEHLVQEVRRLSPFFPLVGARVKQPFDWRGRHFAPGTWVMLDLYGTNRDPRAWERPDDFDPDRFRGREIGPFELVPQGGGDHLAGHRCAGEWITIELMKVAARRLVDGMRYEVPEQDLGVRLSRMPAVPNSRFRIRAVRPA